MFVNTQPIEHQIISEVLEIQNVFLTMQGEGPYAGSPAVFVRTAGCNLQCPMCDTDYTSKRKFWTVDDLVDEVKSKAGKARLVVITGGEPFRQSIGGFVEALYKHNFEVQIETNGTLHIHDFPYCCIVCSPKTGKLNQKFIDEFEDSDVSFKYILEHGKVDPTDGLPTDSLGTGVSPARPPKDFEGEIYVQPLDEQDEEKNKLHTKAALDSCMKFNYRLSLQNHKMLGLP